MAAIRQYTDEKALVIAGQAVTDAQMTPSGTIVLETEGGLVLSLGVLGREMLEIEPSIVTVPTTREGVGLYEDVVVGRWSDGVANNAKGADPSWVLASTCRSVSWAADGVFTSHEISPYVTKYQVDADGVFSLGPDLVPVPSSIPRIVSASPFWMLMAVALSTAPYINIYQLSGYEWVTSGVTISAPPSSIINGIAWSPNGQMVAFATDGDPYLSVYRLSAMNPSTPSYSFVKLADPASPLFQPASSVAWSPDGRYLAVGHSSSAGVNVYRINGRVLTKIASPPSSPEFVRSLAWSPDGRYLAVGGNDPTRKIEVYRRDGDVFTPGVESFASAPAGMVNALSWSPDGLYLAAGMATWPYLRVWRRKDRDYTVAAGLASPPTAAVRSVQWSPNGRYLAVGSESSPYFHYYVTRNGRIEGAAVRMTSAPGEVLS